MSTATNSTPDSMRFEMKATLRARRSSLAITRVARCLQQSPPGSLEFVDLRQEGQQFLRNLDGVCVEHTRNYAGLYRIVCRRNCPIKPERRLESALSPDLEG
jgi:hypothetical protein